MGRPEMKIVLQEEPSGCGIACVAMLAERSYEEVKRLANGMGIFAEDERLYSETAYVRRLLAAYGVQVLDRETPFASWEALPDRASWRSNTGSRAADHSGTGSSSREQAAFRSCRTRPDTCARTGERTSVRCSRDGISS